MTDTAHLKSSALAAIDDATQTILDVGDAIHADPEIGLEEHHAVELLTSTITSLGFTLDEDAGELDTAFKARKSGSKPGPRIAFLAEYDALPGLGHGCGHNLIASSTLAAAIGLGAIIDDVGGEVMFIGTPAEESFGGKASMIASGVFDDVDVALSTHHGGHEAGLPTDYPDGTCLAVSSRRFVYRGRTAHAAADPETGINALNAVIHLFTGLDALRQHVASDVRIHGIITDGGVAPNVVPDHAAAEFLFRAGSRETVDELVKKAENIANGAALMTGATLEIEIAAPDYDDMLPSYSLSQIARDQLDAAGLQETPKYPATGPGAYSTDLGNVSRKVPTTALIFAISDAPISGHSQDVVDGSISSMGRENAIRTGKALALAGVELVTSPEAFERVQREFDNPPSKSA
jgi:amidohydrolase